MVREGFEVSVSVEVRWRDLDPLGHVNNAVYLSYLECARVAWFRALWGEVKPSDFGIIIARIEVDYLAPITLAEVPVCRIAVSEAGNSSFVFSYLLESGRDGRSLARARSVQLCFDYAANEKRPISDDLWERIVALRRERGLPPPHRRSSTGEERP